MEDAGVEVQILAALRPPIAPPIALYIMCRDEPAYS